MIRRTLAAASTAALVIALAPSTPASAKDDPMPEFTSVDASPAKSLDRGTVLELGTGSRPELYFVQLEAPAVPRREVALERGLTQTRSESGYRKELRSEQADLVASISRVAGDSAKVINRYTEALNGIAVRMTRGQAKKVADIDGVSAVQVDFERELTTDKGPEWIGAPTIWDGSNVPGGVGSKGEGIIVGILDSGLNPANPSFADSVPVVDGGDGYDHNLPAGWSGPVGMCDPASDQYVADWGCNDKLIGYWNFEDPANPDSDPFDDVYDDDGHGSHTASTTAGNQVEAEAFSARGTEHEFSVTSTIKGVAPHANIIGYDVCDGGCQGYSIVTSIEQAILDGVDAINYSIGSSAPSNPWTDLDAIGFLNARAAGIAVATSAGNDGPGAATLGSPGDVPWMTTVGATTHDRKYVSSVTGITATDASTLPDIAGAGLSGPTGGSFPLVYAGDYDNPLCGMPDDAPPGTGTSFPAGTDLTGLIIVCDRGGNGRVEKGENVEALGAEGMILANDANSGDSLNGDAHALPAAHITHEDGVSLKQYMLDHPGAQAALSGSVIDVADANGDIMAAFSSRGPNRAMSSISPSVSAPGVDILAAAGTNNSVEWHFISGTSMASPHTAGALALLKAVQPGWSPAESQSALMTTAERNITDSDGTAADWFDMGSGRIELRRAAKAGLVLDETLAGYQGADPAIGGDVRTLNTASMADDECLQTCEWTRTFTGTATGVGTWDVSVESMSADLTLSTDKSQITVTDGGTVDVTVTAEVPNDVAKDKWIFGTLVLTPPTGSDAPVAHLPVGVLPSAGVLPTSIDITTRRDAGSQVESDMEAIAISDLQIEPSGLVPEESVELTIPEDTTNPDPFDGNGTHVEEIEVPADATNLIAKLENPTAPDFDLFVGTGEVSAANVIASSASSGSNEVVEIADPEPGTYWALVQNWEASPSGTDTTDLVTVVVAGDQGNLRAEGPTGALDAGTPFDIRTFWDEKAMEAGQTWHGTLTLGTSEASPGDIGVIPVTIERVEDDVTKTADVEEAAPGDTITYTVEVQPNVTREDLTYTITDTLPAGATYVEGSATDGATFEDGVISWTGELTSTFGEEGNYTLTTSAEDPEACEPGYLDLAALGIDPQSSLVGDTKALSAFASGTFGFYGQNYQGLTFTDDGFLVYGDGYAGSPWVPQAVPNLEVPNNVAALLWQDMELRYDAASGAGVTLASTAGANGVLDPGEIAVVEYDDMRLFGDDAGAAGSLDMQVIATAGSNDLVFVYDNISDGAILDGVTIGTENAPGTVGASLVNQGDASATLENGLAVCANYSEPDAEGASFTYQVTVDDTVGDKNLVNKVVHTTNDPGAKPETESQSVKVTGALERSEVALAVSPDRIETNATTTATATVFSAGDAAPSGEVQFLAGDRIAGTATVGADGKATTTLTGFDTAGTFPVTAKYLGDANTAPSTSTPVNVVVTTPGQAAPKVEPRITVITDRNIREGKRARLKIIITAPNVTPSGTVEVKVRGAVKRKKTYTVTLDSNGMAKLRLSKADLNKRQKKGKIRVKISYSGDAAVLPDKEKLKIRVRR